MVIEGMPDFEHVKKWVARGRLASREAKQADLDGSEHGERKRATMLLYNK